MNMLLRAKNTRIKFQLKGASTKNRSSPPKVFSRKGVLKYAANLQENTHAEV